MRARTAVVGSPTCASGAFQRSMSRTRSSERRFSARSAPTKSSTKSFAGFISSSAGVAYCASTPPFCMTATRSPILIASSMSWVTNRIVLRISDCSRRNWFWSRSRLIGSMAPNGSSISISGRVRGERARHADALALASRQLRRKPVAHVRRQGDELEHLLDALLRCAPGPSPSSRGTTPTLSPIVRCGNRPICWIT